MVVVLVCMWVYFCGAEDESGTGDGVPFSVFSKLSLSSSYKWSCEVHKLPVKAIWSKDKQRFEKCSCRGMNVQQSHQEEHSPCSVHTAAPPTAISSGTAAIITVHPTHSWGLLNLMFNTKQIAEESDHFLHFSKKEENKIGVLNSCFLYTDRTNTSHTTLTE